MRNPVHAVVLVTAASLWLSLLSVPARSHYGLGLDEDPCVRSVGPYLIHFAAYQPQFDPVAEYCDEIPQADNAIFVFDLVDRELRKELTEIKVERQGRENRGLETLFSIPARRYPNGVANAEFRFEGPGEYAAVVTLLTPRRIVRFPLRVAMDSQRWLPFVGGALLFGIPFGYVAFTRFWRDA